MCDWRVPGSGIAPLRHLATTPRDLPRRHAIVTYRSGVRCTQCCRYSGSSVGAKALALALKSDSAADKEPIGLIPLHPTLRPADLLTTAASLNTATAIDVGITSPHGGAAGDDCTQGYAWFVVEIGLFCVCV